MTRDDIIRMAREAGLYHFYDSEGQCTGITNARLVTEDKERWDDRLVEMLAPFAHLVAAAEREACADIADQHASIEGIAQDCAAAIRARKAALAEPENWELRRLSEELERCKQVCAATSEAWREEAALAEPTPLEDVVTHGSAWSKDGKRIDPMSVYAEPVQEPVQCEPQYANEDGWCEWVCPQPRGYLMQCCDCGLIHEVDSRVAKYQPRPSEEFEVVDDPDLQAQWRMKRRDDISPKQAPQRPAGPVQEPVAWRFEARHIDSAWAAAVTMKHPGPEGKYMRKVTPLYAAPPQRKPLTDAEISNIWDGHVVPVFGKNGINPIVFARAIERAHGITP